MSTVRVAHDIMAQLMEEARRAPHKECCGLLVGRAAVITALYPARNALESPTAYEIAPRELFHLMKRIREAGLQLLGIYHSHPAGDNRPSARDIEQAYYPDAAYFIISPAPDAPRPVRAFSIRSGQVTELEIEESPTS